MLSGKCTEAFSIQAIVTISGSSAKLTKNGIAPLPFPLPALLKQYWYIKRGERGRVRGHAPFYATLGFLGARDRFHFQSSPSRYWSSGQSPPLWVSHSCASFVSARLMCRKERMRLSMSAILPCACDRTRAHDVRRLTRNSSRSLISFSVKPSCCAR